MARIKSVENKAEKSEFRRWDPNQLAAPARRHPGKYFWLMKCENTCGCSDDGLSEILLHKLMIKPMSLRRPLILWSRSALLRRPAG